MSLTIPVETENLLRAEEARTGVPVEELLARAVRAQFASAANPPGEEEFLREATQTLSESFWERFRTLAAQHKSGQITELERGELIALVRQANDWHNARLEAGIRLAKRRGVPFEQVRRELHIEPVSVE